MVLYSVTHRMRPPPPPKKVVYLNLARSREGCDACCDVPVIWWGWNLAIGFLDKINLFFVCVFVYFVCVCVCVCVRGDRAIYNLRKISFSWYLLQIWKNKLMRHVTFNPLLFWIAPGLISCFFFYMKYNYLFFSFRLVHFFQGTSVSKTLNLFEHYQLWMMDRVKPKGFSLQRQFFDQSNG